MKKNTQKKPVVLPKKFERAKPLTKKTIEAVNGKRPIEDALIVPPKSKLVHSNHVKSLNEKFWDWLESKPWGTWLVLGVAVLFVTAVAYWGIKQ